MTAPSNSVPAAVVMVVGLKALHNTLSHIFEAMNIEIPLPIPYPFCKNSSSIKTRIPAKTSYRIISTHLTVPISDTFPYIPLTT
jgi:hypothetical protein